MGTSLAWISAMVGQTLTTKGKPYRYYRCRHAYDKNSGHDCSARYIRAGKLDSAVWGEVRRGLSSPEIVLDELKRLQVESPANEDINRINGELNELAQRERRLIELIVDGGVNKEALDEKAHSCVGKGLSLSSRCTRWNGLTCTSSTRSIRSASV